MTETTLYIGGLVERVDASDPTFRHYIPAGSNTVVYSRTYGGQVRTYYATGDHFGSTTAVTCGLSANPVDSTCTSGSVLVKESFGAFGNRRGSNWTGTPSGGDMTKIGASTRRGFTFHEHLDNLSLIHMNGRVFDPALGRFLSADPFVPDPDNTQSFNRYSYVYNNPLSFTDPSGFCAPPECGTEVVGGPLYDREPHFSSSPPDYRHGIPLNDPSLLFAKIRDADWEQIAKDWWPGYQLGSCIYESISGEGCGATKWTMAIIGAVPLPAAKGAQAARGLGSLDDLSRAAGALDRGGLSAAGRQLQKHGSRSGSAFPGARGNPAAINRQAQDIVDELLTTPGTSSVTRHHARFGDVLEIRAPDGRGLRYGADGKFFGFLEPRP